MQLQKIYISGPSSVVLCIDRRTAYDMEGRIFHQNSAEAIPFHGLEDIIRIMDQFYTELNVPFPGNNERSFSQGESPPVRHAVDKEVNKMRNEDLLEQQGKDGTFIVHVQQRQNSSWQGKVTWVESKKSVYFRSALELIKLIDGAMDETEKKTLSNI